MKVFSDFAHPWNSQNFNRYKKSYKELKDLLKKDSKSKNTRFLLVTILEFMVIMILIILGTQATKVIGADFNKIDNIITIIALILSIYFLSDFIIKFKKINSALPSSLFLKNYKNIRDSFKSFFALFLTTYGIYLIIILNSIFNQEQNYKAIFFLKNIENNLSFYQENFVILMISVFTIGIMVLIWIIESLMHKNMFHKIEKNLNHLV